MKRTNPKVSNSNRNRVGKNHPMWKGGKKVVKNRVYIWVNNGKYVVRARLVMEKYLKRKLKSTDIVHHINENTLDDSIGNLQIMTRASHRAYHNKDKIGFKHSEETKNKFREIHKGHIPWNTGKHLSEEHKFKISKTQIGRVFSEESKMKMRKPKSLETRKRMKLAWIIRRKNAKNS